ncbi:unnamed protein product, partial [Brassica oleracea]
MFFNSGDLGYQGIKETVDLGFDGSQEGFVIHQIEGFGEYPKRRQIYDCEIGVNLWASVVFFSATRRELGLGLRGQVIVLLALQPVPLNQLQRAGLELDKVFRLFIMGKKSEERVWSRVYSAVRGHVLAFVCEIGISAGVGKAKDLVEPRIFLWTNMFFF